MDPLLVEASEACDRLNGQLQALYRYSGLSEDAKKHIQCLENVNIALLAHQRLLVEQQREARDDEDGNADGARN